MSRRRKGKGSTKRLADVIPLVYPRPEELDIARVFAHFCDVLPERVVANARPVRLARGTLEVNVTSASWANELSFLERDLVLRLSRGTPRADVRRIRFRVGPLPDLPERVREKKKRRVAVPLAELPPELGRALAHIGDDALREAILAAASAGLGKLEDAE